MVVEGTVKVGVGKGEEGEQGAQERVAGMGMGVGREVVCEGTQNSTGGSSW
jgi:hypothetical protein